MERKDALREAVVTSIERDILRVHRAFRIWYTMTVRLETHHQVDGLPMQRGFTPEANIEAQKIEEYISLEKDETPEIPTDPIRSESEKFDPMTFIMEQMEKMKENPDSNNGLEVLKALVEAQKKNQEERVKNLERFHQDQIRIEAEKQRLLGEMALLNQGEKPDYELNPSDIINEEDIEESTGEMSAMKKLKGSHIESISGSLKSLSKKQASPFVKKEPGMNSDLKNLSQLEKNFNKLIEDTKNNF